LNSLRNFFNFVSPRVVFLNVLLIVVIVQSNLSNDIDLQDFIDRKYMMRALALASLANGETRPNPIVGCVIIDSNGTVVAESWHKKSGYPHAEVGALKSAENKAINGTAYVSLEPCNHYGKTPPCTLSLLK
jgi:diaminohydroxyphosphoribosylaminopyrimidine deaminase/5-amino-6-(5-phosphoribosylamino)uracil reductase